MRPGRGRERTHCPHSTPQLPGAAASSLMGPSRYQVCPASHNPGSGPFYRGGGSSLVVQWLGLRAPTAGDMGSIPGWGTKIPQAEWLGQIKKRKRSLGWGSHWPELRAAPHP